MKLTICKHDLTIMRGPYSGEMQVQLWREEPPADWGIGMKSVFAAVFGIYRLYVSIGDGQNYWQWMFNRWLLEKRYGR